MKDWMRKGSLCPDCSKKMEKRTKGLLGHLIWTCECGVEIQLFFPSRERLAAWAERCLEEILKERK